MNVPVFKLFKLFQAADIFWAAADEGAARIQAEEEEAAKAAADEEAARKQAEAEAAAKAQVEAEEATRLEAERKRAEEERFASEQEAAAKAKAKAAAAAAAKAKAEADAAEAARVQANTTKTANLGKDPAAHDIAVGTVVSARFQGQHKAWFEGKVTAHILFFASVGSTFHDNRISDLSNFSVTALPAGAVLKAPVWLAICLPRCFFFESVYLLGL